MYIVNNSNMKMGYYIEASGGGGALLASGTVDPGSSENLSLGSQQVKVWSDLSISGLPSNTQFVGSFYIDPNSQLVGNIDMLTPEGEQLTRKNPPTEARVPRSAPGKRPEVGTSNDED